MKFRPLLKAFLDRNGSMIMNMIVCFGILNWMVENTAPSFMAGKFDFVDTMFLLHNVVMLALILIRRNHQAIDGSFFHQAIAVAAFFSGLAFIGEPTRNPALLAAADAVILVALVLGTATLFNLGRSFGILIAYRKVEDSFLYSIIRHPMYMTDLLWKVGIVLKKPCYFNLGILLLSAACYVYRALLEERFLSQQEQYRDYMKKVRYRFIPGVF